MPESKKGAQPQYNYTGFCIRSLRRGKGESQKELAKQLNKSESAVRMWELGKSEPDIETLKLLARHFGVSVSYLIDERYTTAMPDENDLYEYERLLIKAYRENPEMHDAVNMLLGIDSDEYVRLYAAVRSV
jgi:transcriptional regulator with XRE-family HTH domain